MTSRDLIGFCFTRFCSHKTEANGSLRRRSPELLYSWLWLLAEHDPNYTGSYSAVSLLRRLRDWLASVLRDFVLIKQKPMGLLDVAVPSYFIRGCNFSWTRSKLYWSYSVGDYIVSTSKRFWLASVLRDFVLIKQKPMGLLDVAVPSYFIRGCTRSKFSWTRSKLYWIVFS